MPKAPLRIFFARIATCLLLCGALHPSVAHDLPGTVSLLVYVKPQDQQLLVLTRVPMEALTEVQFPVRGPGYLDLEHADSALKDAAQMYVTHGLKVFADGVALEAGQLLKARVALPGDKSFVDFASALATVNSAPLGNNADLYWKQAALDVLVAYPIASERAKFAIESSLARISSNTHTVLRFVAPGGTERIFNFVGDPGRVVLDPGWWYATYRFVELGFFHILDGIDHILFLLCLVIPTRSVRALVPAITAFTVAHSITLISSALGLTPTTLWFAPLIETLIALSVFYMAAENVFGIHLQKRWLLVFAFGLIHGFGFSFILADRMQFAGEHLVSALLAFNIGVELGQLAVLIVAVPLLGLFFRYIARVASDRLSSERIGAIALSALVAHSAWHWLAERTEKLLRYSWQTPTFDAVFFVAALRWGMVLLGTAGVIWAMNELFNRFAIGANAKQGQ